MSIGKTRNPLHILVLPNALMLYILILVIHVKNSFALLFGVGGVGHAGVVDGAQALDEGILDGGDVAERDG